MYYYYDREKVGIKLNNEELEYISDFISDMYTDDNVVRILKQNYAFIFNESDYKKLEIDSNYSSFYFDYSGTKLLKAYEPFLDIIRDIIIKYKLNINEILDELKTYSLNNNLFISYVETGYSSPIEEPIFSEISFNKKRFIDDLVNILLYLSDIHPIFLTLNNFHRISLSSIDIINKIINYKSDNLKIFIITNAMGFVDEYVLEKYNSTLEECSYLGLVYEWPISNYVENNESKKSFISENSDVELKNIETLYNTFAYEQAYFYLNHIYQKIELEKVHATDDYRFKMILLYIKTCIGLKKFSAAIIFCDRLLTINIDSNTKEKDYNYYYYQAYANMYMGNDSLAIQGAEKCCEIAISLRNEFLLFKAMLLHNMSQLSGWNGVWICDKNITVPKRLEELCIKYKYFNHLSHIYVYDFENDYHLYETSDGVEERTPIVTKGIQIAKKLGNDQFLFEAYRKNVMISSVNGLFETSNYFYLKSIDVVKRNNDTLEEGNIYNGLGYNNVTIGNYEEANKYYNKALKIFTDNASSDYISETLYNMGTNALLAGDFGNATNYLTMVVQIIQSLRMGRLRVCNNSKVYGLLAISSFFQGNYFTAQTYANKSEHFLMYAKEYLESDNTYGHQWDDDLFLYYVICGLIATRNEKYEIALNMFNESEFYMNRSQGSYFLNFAFYSMGLSLLYKATNKPEERKVILENAYKFYETHNNHNRAMLFKNVLETGNPNYPFLNIGLTDVDMDDVMNIIKIESIKKEANTKDAQIRFFGTFQELTSRSYDSVDDQLTTLVSTFKSNFRLDNMLYVSYEKGTPEIKYSDFEYEISQKDIDFISNYFQNNVGGFAVNQYSDNFYDYEKIAHIFNRSTYFSLMGAPVFKDDSLYSFCIVVIKVNQTWNSASYRDTVDKKDLDIFTLFFRLLIDSCEKYQLNEKLMLQAVTDELTGLLNRQGYYKLIEQRLNSSLVVGHEFNCAFLYIDLDHFKYYNDTFGHQVGDEILKKFASIFKTACKGKGFAVRFGGDEFVIIINNPTKTRITSVCNKIYSSIEKEDGFKKIVEKFLPEEVNIPKEHRATCSIGYEINNQIISMADISEMEKHADATLYYIKKHGRGYAMSYSNFLEVSQDKNTSI